jgi:small subunit ribosomal protein S3Ae
MAVGKGKKFKKGSKKKVVDIFTKKEWYDVKAPAYFGKRDLGKTLVTRTQGTKLAADGLRGRVFEVNQADMDSQCTFRKFRLVCEEVSGRDLLLNFTGMSLTTDKLRSLVKKWQTLIECFVDAKTTDGYVLRVFCISFTQKQTNSARKCCYAKSSQIKDIRAKMREVIEREVSSGDLVNIVKRLSADEINKDVEKACKTIYPLHDTFIRKVKVLKKPRFDMAKLLELHGGSGKATKGGKVARDADFVEPAVLESV